MKTEILKKIVWITGANGFVAGSSIFGSSDYEKTIQSFRQKIS